MGVNAVPQPVEWGAKAGNPGGVSIGVDFSKDAHHSTWAWMGWGKRRRGPMDKASQSSPPGLWRPLPRRQQGPDLPRTDLHWDRGERLPRGGLAKRNRREARGGGPEGRDASRARGTW